MMQASGQAIDITGLSRRYGQVQALHDVSLQVRPGEFLALLGPSGSGKSTLLMAIAGFEQPDAGSISIGGRPMRGLPPHRRNIGMVFQRYALFPHLSVAENVAYPLRRRGVRAPERTARVAAALEAVRLAGYGERSTEALSGGQQQRVALARALVFEPGVLLLDEPMSALDRKLRQQMQMELKELHARIGGTVVLVTHDQEEAMSMADRVALLEGGRLRQLGTPDDLYRRPADAFVADFIGRTNFLPVESHAGGVRVTGFHAPLTDALATECPPPAPGQGIGVRPEHVLVGAPGEGEPCTILQANFAGAQQHLLVQAGMHRLQADVPATGRLWQPGETALLRFHPGSCRPFHLPQPQEPA